MELSLATSIAWDTWRLNHLRAVEMNIYALGATDPANAVDCDTPHQHTAMTSALTFIRESAKLALMSAYEQRLNRNIHQNAATLRELKAERKQDHHHDRAQEATIAQASSLQGLPYNAPPDPSENGFVFSTSEIVATANREAVMIHAHSIVGLKSPKVFLTGTSDAPNPIRPNSGVRVTASA